MTAFKQISYRGGLITFRIPATWREEYEPDGGGTFYEEGSQSTLRLNVLTMESKSDLLADSAVRAVTRSNGNRQTRKLDNGYAVARYVTASTERDIKLQLHTWELAGPLPPRHMRIAIFAHTILESEAASPAIAAELEMLDQIIISAEFAKIRGVTPLPAKKSWWRK